MPEILEIDMKTQDQHDVRFILTNPITLYIKGSIYGFLKRNFLQHNWISSLFRQIHR